MSKYETIDLERFSEMFKALGNPHRLAILLRLVSCCSPGTRWVASPEARRFVGQLGEDLDIVASTLSHHIKELRRCGLIRAERRGKNIECWVDAEALKALGDLLASGDPSREAGSEAPEDAENAAGKDL